MDRPLFSTLTPGTNITARSRRWRIDHMLSQGAFLATDLATQETDRLSANEVQGIDWPEDSQFEPEVVPDLGLLDGPAWEEAQRRLAAIQPLIDNPTRSRADVAAAGSAAGASPATVYGWIKAYERSGHISSLMPRKRGRKVGTTRLDPVADAIVNAAIKNVFMTKDRRLVSEVVVRVEDDAEGADLRAPHGSTVYRRINRLKASSPYAVALARGEKRDIRRFTPAPGKFPPTDRPMQVVQIDHTNRNVVGLDEDLLPLGRPYITLAIDVFTRMVIGIVTSPERPNAATAGAIVAQIMLPKEPVLAAVGVEGDWPVWGKPELLLMDNAGEFDSKDFKAALNAHTIRHDFRPPGSPWYGGHIEALMLVEARSSRNLPGKTFASVAERQDHKPEKEAVLTMDQLETQVFEFFINQYNLQGHSGIGGMAPLDKWKEAIFGCPKSKGVGLPKMPTDHGRLRIDFLPRFEATIQRTGARIEGFDYWDPVLTPYLLEKVPGTKRSRKFVFRRDPRKISPVYFFDPRRGNYVEVHYADRTMPVMSVWEKRAEKASLKRAGKPRHQQAIKESRYKTAAMIADATDEKLARDKALRKAKARASATKRAQLQTPADPPNLRQRRAPEPIPATEDDIYSQPVTPSVVVDLDP